MIITRPVYVFGHLRSLPERHGVDKPRPTIASTLSMS